MQKLTGDRLAQAEVVPFSKFQHSANRFVTSVRVGLRIVRQLGKCRVENFVHRVVTTTSKLLINDPFLIGLESNGHISTVRRIGAVVNSMISPPKLESGFQS